MTRRYAFSAMAALLLGTAACVVPARATSPPSIAVFSFILDNTSPAASTADELDRTGRLGKAFSAALQHSGLYRPVDTSRSAAMLRGQDIRSCNGCELPVARTLGADLAAYGWVQKVSNLILNINVVVEDARTGKMVKGGSVDIRGNTDESWDRGLKFLLEEHVFTQ